MGKGAAPKNVTVEDIERKPKTVSPTKLNVVTKGLIDLSRV